MNSGVHSISSGSSTRPMTSCSRQNASMRASSSRQNATIPSPSGWSAAIASRVPRTRAPSSSGAGSPGRQRGQISREMRTISERTAANSASARTRTASGVTNGSWTVCRSLAANRSYPSAASPVAAGTTSAARCRPMAVRTDSACAAAARRRGRTAATAGSFGAAASAPSRAPRPRSATPAIRRPAISACSRETGRGPEPSLACASAMIRGIPSRRPATDASRTWSGANSRVVSGSRPMPSR